MMAFDREVLEAIYSYNPLEEEFLGVQSIADIPVEELVPVPKTPAGFTDPIFYPSSSCSPLSFGFLTESGTPYIYVPGNAFGGYGVFAQDDLLHDRAEDALKARFTFQAPVEAPLQPTLQEEIGLAASQYHGYETTIEVNHIGASVELQHDTPPAFQPMSVQTIIPNLSKPPKKSNKRRAETPQMAYHAPSPSSSYSQDSDFDEDFTPSHSTKRQKRSASYGMGHKTQLQMVLEDLPFTLEDIIVSNGFYFCPFPGCNQTTASEGDLGRHLESKLHATHNYVCLASKCLDQFARHDSMKRHHQNSRGKHHKVEHDLAIQMGFSCRVRLREIPTLKQRLVAAISRIDKRPNNLVTSFLGPSAAGKTIFQV